MLSKPHLFFPTLRYIFLRPSRHFAQSIDRGSRFLGEKTISSLLEDRPHLAQHRVLHLLHDVLPVPPQDLLVSLGRLPRHLQHLDRLPEVPLPLERPGEVDLGLDQVGLELDGLSVKEFF